MTKCQALGCQELALPWSFTVELDALAVELRLCRRHELELRLGGTEPRPSEEKQPA